MYRIKKAKKHRGGGERSRLSVRVNLRNFVNYLSYARIHTVIFTSITMPFEQTVRESTFETAKTAITSVLEEVPVSLRPEVKMDEIAIYSNSEYLNALTQDNINHGMNERDARLRAKYEVEIRPNVFFLATRQIAILKLDQEKATTIEWVRRTSTKNSEIGRFFRSEHYFSLISHNLGRSVIPHYENVDLETAASTMFLNEEQFKDILKETFDINIDLNKCSFNLVGRMVRVYDENGIFVKEVGHPRDKKLQDIFAESYSVYLTFLASDEYKLEGSELEKLERFREGVRFRRQLDLDNMPYPFILDAAIKVGGFENLLTNLKELLNPFNTNINHDRVEMEALSQVVTAFQALELYNSISQLLLAGEMDYLQDELSRKRRKAPLESQLLVNIQKFRVDFGRVSQYEMAQQLLSIISIPYKKREKAIIGASESESLKMIHLELIDEPDKLSIIRGMFLLPIEFPESILLDMASFFVEELRAANHEGRAVNYFNPEM